MLRPLVFAKISSTNCLFLTFVAFIWKTCKINTQLRLKFPTSSESFLTVLQNPKTDFFLSQCLHECFTNIFNNLICMFMFNFVLGSLLVSIFQYSAWLFFICVFQTDFCTIFTSFNVRAAQPRVPHSVYCTLVPREITFISTFLSTLCTTSTVKFHSWVASVQITS